MKKSDWALIILIVAVVGVASYFVVGAILPSPGDNPEIVETAESISDKISEPSDQFFGAEAINPTQKVTTGNQSDRQPFVLEGE